MLGALDSASKSRGADQIFSNTADAFALISQNSASSGGDLVARVASERIQREVAQKLQEAFSAAPRPPPRVQLDPIIFFENGSTLDTTNNILTLSDGRQIDSTTGAPVIDPKSVVSFANGSYLDTKNNVLTLADGKRIDTVTGLLIAKSV